MAKVAFQVEADNLPGGQFVFDIKISQATASGPVEILRDSVVVDVPATANPGPVVTHTPPLVS